MQTAMRPGTLPIPSSMTTGMRYTNAGIVCMMSRIGVIAVWVRSERAMRMPSGIPTAMHSIVATEMIARVDIVSIHMPK